MKNNYHKQSRLNLWISLGLTIGTALSLGLIAIGFTLAAISGSTVEPMATIGQLSQEILKLNPAAVITLGILILLLTPLAQVIIAAIAFARSQDKVYFGVSLALLSILIFSLLLSLL